MPYETAEEIISKQKKIVVSDCICRKEHDMVGQPCDYPREVCLTFGSGAYYYEGNGLGRGIDVEEALAILEKGRQAGLVLQPGNAKDPGNICMCCGCCCQVLANLKTPEQPAKAVHSNYYARVDADECVACVKLCGPLSYGCRYHGGYGGDGQLRPVYRLRGMRAGLSVQGHCFG